MYNIAVVFGGVTPEHSISIITAIGAIKNLSLNYNPVPIYINTAGEWLTGKHLLDAESYHTEPKGKECFLKPNCSCLFTKNALGYSKTPIDCALLCLHGGLYEGGAVQGVLDLAGIPYTSPAILPSAVGMDKVVSKLLFKSLNILTPKFVWGESKNSDDLIFRVGKKLSFPLIVKPARCGSSVGIARVQNEEDLRRAVDNAGLFDDKIIIEEALSDCRELNVALMRSKGEVKVSSIEEIKCEHPIYSFEDKYSQTAEVERIVPASVSLKIMSKILNSATAVYDVLGMDGVVRFDFLIVGERVYLNEVNTIPGSLAFYLWKNEGLSFAQLLNITIKNARAREARMSVVQYNAAVLHDLDKIKTIMEK